MSDQTKKDILWATANKFFPGWETDSGLVPDPWIQVTKGTTILEIHVPRSVPLDKFEEEAWWQFKKAKDAFELDEATEAANDD